MNNKSIYFVSWFFSVMSFCMFVLTSSGVLKKNVDYQDIYWFILSLLCSIIPFIKQFKYKDFEVTLQKEMSKLESKIDSKLELVTKEFDSAWDYWKKVEDNAENREYKDRVYSNFNKSLNEKSLNERLSIINKFNIMYLKKFEMPVSQLQQGLTIAGLYDGEINDELDEKTVEAIKGFQMSLNLVNDGIFGVDSYKALSKVVSESR